MIDKNPKRIRFLKVMATLSLVILKNRPSKKGMYDIFISLAHRHKTSYIKTPYSVDGIKEFHNGMVTGRNDKKVLNFKLFSMLEEYQNVLDSVNTDKYDCIQLKEFLKSHVHDESDCTFQSVSKGYSKELLDDGRTNYAKLINWNCNLFTEFAGDEYQLSDITPHIISEYNRFLSIRLSDTSVGMAMARMKVIINRAVKLQLVKYEIHPFDYYKIQKSQVRDISISVEELRKIRDYSPKTKRMTIARDVFMLSYYLGGINLVDLWNADFGSRDITYVRTKSKRMKSGEKRISLTIPGVAKEIINKYMKKGKLDFGTTLTYNNFSSRTNKYIHMMAERLELPDYLTYYSARKSFAQHAFELGVPLEVIEYCIGQSMKTNRPIFNYVKIMRSHADKAITSVVDNLFSDKKKSSHPSRKKALSICTV